MSDSRVIVPERVPRPAVPLSEVTSVLEAMRMLDVFLNRERDWPAALNRSTLFRIPDFETAFVKLYDEARAAGHVASDEEFSAAFRTQAKQVASQLHKQAADQWNDIKYGVQQLQHARAGQGMRFDKAVISVLALNRLSKRYSLCETCYLPPHSVVACVFYFANLRNRLRRYAATFGGNHSDEERMRLAIAEVAKASGQSEAVVDALAGEAVVRETKAEIAKAVTTLGSYPTQFAIYQFLAQHQPELLNANLQDVIVRRRVQTQNLEIIEDEVIIPFGRVTTGPYAWPLDGTNDHVEFPEGGPPPPATR